METFRTTLFECLEEKCPDLEPEVPHDIPTWIEANAPLVTSANIRIMATALPEDDPRAHWSLIEFHRVLDPSQCEAEQICALLEVWSDIEARIRARLALSEPRRAGSCPLARGLRVSSPESLVPSPSLPTGDGLNIAALAGLFRHTTNSYTFVFFLALLDRLKRHRFDAERPYAYAEITLEMLALAWFPHTCFKLSFGAQDTIAKKLDALDLALDEGANLFANDRRALRGALAAVDLKDAARLMDFVPYRLQIPFLEPQLRGVDKGAWMVFEKAMPAIANAHFETVRPLYR
jgi:hypothetical protein